MIKNVLIFSLIVIALAPKNILVNKPILLNGGSENKDVDSGNNLDTTFVSASNASYFFNFLRERTVL